VTLKEEGLWESLKDRPPGDMPLLERGLGLPAGETIVLTLIGFIPELMDIVK